MVSDNCNPPNCVAWGDTSKHLPYSCLSVGSQTTHAMTRANLAGADLERDVPHSRGGATDALQLQHGRPGRRGRAAAAAAVLVPVRVSL